MSHNLPELPKASQATYARLSKVAEDYRTGHVRSLFGLPELERAALELSMRTMAQELRDGCHEDPRAMVRILVETRDAQERTEAPESNRAKARDALASLLSDELGRVKYAPGSRYRTAKNPNPDGLTVEDVDTETDRGRGRLPALNVKAYPDLRGIDWEELRAELGIDAARVAPTGRYVDEDGTVCEDSDEGATPELLPFGREWIEARYDLNERGSGRSDRQAELSEGPESWARESAWEWGTERAEELFGKGGLGYRIRVEGRGRSGGYFCLDGLPDMHELSEKLAELREARDKYRLGLRKLALLLGLPAEASQEDVDAAPDREDKLADFDAEREAVDELRDEVAELADECDEGELESLLGAWSELADDAKASVADLGRATAWNVGANVFQPAAEEHEAELVDKANEAELASRTVTVDASERTELYFMLRNRGTSSLKTKLLGVLRVLDPKGAAELEARDAS